MPPRLQLPHFDSEVDVRDTLIGQLGERLPDASFLLPGRGFPNLPPSLAPPHMCPQNAQAYGMGERYPSDEQPMQPRAQTGAHPVWRNGRMEYSSRRAFPYFMYEHPELKGACGRPTLITYWHVVDPETGEIELDACWSCRVRGKMLRCRIKGVRIKFPGPNMQIRRPRLRSLVMGRASADEDEDDDEDVDDKRAKEEDSEADNDDDDNDLKSEPESDASKPPGPRPLPSGTGHLTGEKLFESFREPEIIDLTVEGIRPRASTSSSFGSKRSTEWRPETPSKRGRHRSSSSSSLNSRPPLRMKNAPPLPAKSFIVKTPTASRPGGKTVAKPGSSRPMLPPPFRRGPLSADKGKSEGGRNQSIHSLDPLNVLDPLDLADLDSDADLDCLGNPAEREAPGGAAMPPAELRRGNRQLREERQDPERRRDAAERRVRELERRSAASERKVAELEKQKAEAEMESRSLRAASVLQSREDLEALSAKNKEIARLREALARSEARARDQGGSGGGSSKT